MSSFLKELQRRNVFKVAIVYAITAWLIAQIINVIEHPLHLPEWFATVVIVLLAIGFPLALILAWAYELTPEGIKPTQEVAREQSITHETSRRLNYIIMGLLFGVLLGAGSFWLVSRDKGTDKVQSDFFPQIEKYIDAGDWEAAFTLAEQIESQTPDNPLLEELWPQFSWVVTIPSEPAGAIVYRKAYAAPDSEWKPLGTTPLENIRIPFGLSMLRFELAGYRPLLRTLGGGGGFQKVYEAGPVNIVNVVVQSFKLDTEESLPEGKVRVPGWSEAIDGEMLTFGDYFLDKYEITNRQYKAFMDAGGYQRPEYWEYPFERDDQAMSWAEGIALFTDRTGRPGPSTWVAGDYPDGQDEFPVSGVSWYEAAAYARYAREELPTVYHWRRAVAPGTLTWTVPPSNLNSDGPVAVGSTSAQNWAGTYDMFGNVREWCFNTTGVQRFILGGGWNDVDYEAATYESARPAFDRSPGNGFRLASTRDDATVAARRPVPPSVSIAIDKDTEVPVSDDTFTAYRRIYAYDPLPLNAQIEQTESNRNWTRTRVTIDGAGHDERMALYLYLPEAGTPPFQIVVYWPGAQLIFFDSIDKLNMDLDFLVKNGRAVAIPVFKDTLERGGRGRAALPDRDSKAFRDLNIQWATEYRRVIDYLETRADIDIQRIAYFGASWGGVTAPAVLALEPRIKTAVLLVTGVVRFDPLMMQGSPSFPEIYPVTYLPRVTVPVLMLSGADDNIFPLEISARPYFELLGTPAEHKKQIVEPGGHFFPRAVLIRETMDWLDKYLGAVR